MDTAVINIRVDSKVKSQIQKIAKEMGLSLSGLINALIKQVVRTKRVEFDLVNEELSDFLIESLRASEAERKAGETSPSFDNVDEAIAWLDDKNRQYGN